MERDVRVIYTPQRPTICAGALTFRAGDDSRERAQCHRLADPHYGLCNSCRASEAEWRSDLKRKDGDR